MQKKKQKYYVVWHGQRPGIYTTWETCQIQIKNFPNAVYKSFSTREEAEDAYASGPEPRTFAKRGTSKKDIRVIESNEKNILRSSISVDAACSGNPGMMEYRGVWTEDKTELFHFGPVRDGTNNIGEFLALVHALAMLQKKNDTSTPIYTDSKTAMSWVARKKANTKLKPNHHNASLFDMIRRAEKWLQDNTWKNKILKWDTEKWGEIPADFGRK